MLPTNTLFIPLGLAALLIVFRYLDAWLFLRGEGGRLRQLASVPYPMRAKLPRPSYFAVARSTTIVFKLIASLLVVPIMVGLATAMRPEWITAIDIVVALLSLVILIAFALLDGRILAAMRQHYDVPANWRSLLR